MINCPETSPSYKRRRRWDWAPNDPEKMELLKVDFKASEEEQIEEEETEG
jgi:hypothetical protein